MTGTGPRIVPFGDASLLVVLGNVISRDRNRRALAVAAAVGATLDVVGGWGAPVPSYASVLVPYEPDRMTFGRASERLAQVVTEVLERPLPPEADRPIIDIPTRYGGEDGPDLASVAEQVGMAEAAVVASHAGRVYRVYTLGFAPGFAYLGTLPRQLALPRRTTPRAHVPAGSVAIAGRQTAVYPLETPGGWHLLGRTDLRLWDPSDPDVGLRPGDRVRFVAVGA